MLFLGKSTTSILPSLSMSLEVAHLCPLKANGPSADDACACNNQVDSVKKEISRLEQALSEHRAQMQQVLMMMNERHSVVGSLPTEVISMIFKAYLESGEVTIESMVACYRSADPSLWTTVYVCVPDRKKGNEELEIFEEEVMTSWLARSKALPLDVKVYSKSDNYERMHPWKALFDIVQKHSSRWRTLELYPFQITSPIHWGFQMISPKIPNGEAEVSTFCLQRLHIEYAEWEIVNDLARIPSLTYLRCDVILKLNNENLSAEWKYLTRLRFDKIAVEDAVTVLGKAINVVECEFTFHWYDHPSWSNVAHVPPVHSSLKSLTISFRNGCIAHQLAAVQYFFSSVIARSLNTLSFPAWCLNVSGDHGVEFKALFTRWLHETSLNKITFHGIDYAPISTDETPTITSLPSTIRHLVLTSFEEDDDFTCDSDGFSLTGSRLEELADSLYSSENVALPNLSQLDYWGGTSFDWASVKKLAQAFVTRTSPVNLCFNVRRRCQNIGRRQSRRDADSDDSSLDSDSDDDIEFNENDSGSVLGSPSYLHPLPGCIARELLSLPSQGNGQVSVSVLDAKDRADLIQAALKEEQQLEGLVAYESSK
ncbi:hypothetical protein D9613_004907 [Agrocybe pediades]|uniref:Uncharacterized protein n=1 Tax=Agrocybe pediades TaxID=84607 RepID=A0A8H4QX99_9AGAR|nr:hypothetical protein D9613_004907 [Agrocybe pediades]